MMEINWWKSMPRRCEPCFLIKDPKLLFSGMGCFPHAADPALRDAVPSLWVWAGAGPGGHRDMAGGTGLAQPSVSPAAALGSHGCSLFGNTF